jgi:TPR repeat protein
MLCRFKLGECYEKGIGTAKDEVKALNLYTKASSQGHTLAHSKVGQQFLRGNGTSTKKVIILSFFKAMDKVRSTISSVLQREVALSDITIWLGATLRELEFRKIRLELIKSKLLNIIK